MRVYLFIAFIYYRYFVLMADGEVIDESLKDLKKRRSVTRAAVTRLVTVLESKCFLVASSVTQKERDEMYGILSTLCAKRDQLCALDDEIAVLLFEEDIESDVETSTTYSLKLNTAIAALQNKLSKENSKGSILRGTSPKVKLPKLVLPQFTGNRLKFQEFWDMFDSSVHSNPDLSKVDKFNYLHSCLNRDAKQCITGLSLTEKNYDVAVELLKKRFGGREERKREHMKQLFNVSCSSNTVKSLRAFHDEINANRFGLDNLGTSAEEYESFLVPVLVSKLPDAVRLDMLKCQKLPLVAL